ncbi:MAG: sodium:solute symporter family protein [Clostridia bacterium]|nr:sodium:solute symporter family protein [Clostridia bacterium]MBR4954575.1 sodium:solute symporter family protein [Clostridia bacterium]MBR5903174.1 sodium:solute symporter family protein [Clostridia bacterium]
MTLSAMHILGIALTLVLIALVGAASGKKVKNAADFERGGGKTGSMIVAGTIIGTLVGGQATVGTAQLAFSYGFSAWWFTLGSGLGCLALALGYSKSMRHSGRTTLVGVIEQEYGKTAGYISSTLSALGSFFSLLSNMLALSALLCAILPINMLTALIIAVVLASAYVIFGGVWGAGMGGVLKLLLLCIACAIGAVMVLYFSSGHVMQPLSQLLDGTAMGSVAGLDAGESAKEHFISLVSRGVKKDLGSGLSLILGVLSTQTYAQAIWSAKSDKSAKKGALISAVMIPPIGVACILIGLYMRAHYITTAEIAALAELGQAVPEGLREIASSSQVFPTFVLNHMPKLLGGTVLGTLLITIVGGGAGLALGIATILSGDIIKKLTHRFDSGKSSLLMLRVLIVIILTAAACGAGMVPGAVINDYGFLSMALRAAVIFVPFSCALFLKGKIAKKCAPIAIIAGPATVIAGNLLNIGFDPLILGIGVSMIIMAAGAVINRKNTAL